MQDAPTQAVRAGVEVEEAGVLGRGAWLVAGAVAVTCMLLLGPSTPAGAPFARTVPVDAAKDVVPNRVMTWNLCNPCEESNVDRAAEIAAYAPQVVGLQEACVRDVERIRDHLANLHGLEYHVEYGPVLRNWSRCGGLPWKPGGYGQALLSAAPMTDVVTEEYPDGGSEDRGYIAVTTEVAGQTVRVFNTHLAQRRQESVREGRPRCSPRRSPGTNGPSCSATSTPCRTPPNSPRSGRSPRTPTPGAGRHCQRLRADDGLADQVRLRVPARAFGAGARGAAQPVFRSPSAAHRRHRALIPLKVLLVGAIRGYTFDEPTSKESVMGIIAWIFIGLIVYAIAKALMPGKDPGGIIITMLIGIAGGLLGGFLGKVMFGVDSIDGFFDLSTWIAAIIGSVILLALYRVFTGRSRRGGHAHA